MKKRIMLVVLTTSLYTLISHAEETTVDSPLSFNAAITSDYRFRGISQSRLDPALSMGVDYIHDGFYVGGWASTIKWIKDSRGHNTTELDLYAGKRGQLYKKLTYDVGFIQYAYPNNGLSTNANTSEIYAQLGYGPAYLKYSSALTNLFGVNNSKNSGYWDAGTNIEITHGYVMNLHIGHQTVQNTASASYTDWKVGVTKDFGFMTTSLAVVGTNNDTYRGYDNVNLGKTGLVLNLSKSF